MTALKLFLLIAAGILLQIAVAGGMAFYRHWQVYQEMKNRLAGLNGGIPTEETPVEKVVKKDENRQEDAWSGLREFRVEKKEYEDAAGSICSFYLLPTDGQPLPSFLPGQFLTFSLDLPEKISGEHKTTLRCYSLSDRPGLPYYRVTIKRMPPPGIVSNIFHDHIQEGSLLQMKAPSGHFYLDEKDAPLVLVAGGIGITPLLSMINTRFAANTSQEIWLFYGVRNGNELIMGEHLQTLAARYPHFHLHLCFSQPLPNERAGRDFQHQGHVDITLLRLTLSLKPYRFYVCGPRGMMESLIPALEAWGVPEEHLHYESFGPASLSKTAQKQTALSHSNQTAPPITVTFIRSGKSLIWDGESDSLLQFAERHGIEVASGCRAGGCGACQTKIESGGVDYIQSPDFVPERGHCLLCISRPQRDVTLLA
ncbi:MAG: 2Fe-2S iron-sulfur cluster binding domain-containing protein [Magnetococcales bacterium]|nr:2Fe-2S iron-sulfur cluster binding domain-containing protein [Magnetococcales bacterium]